MNMVTRLKRAIHNRVHSEMAENTITFLIAVPLRWSIIMTIMDYGVFVGNTSMLRSDLRDGARTAAIFGGTDNALSAAYGTNCKDAPAKAGSKGGGTDSSNIVTCLVANKINDNTAYVNNMTISNIKCGPSGGTKVGDATWCSADYLYAGIPGSVLGLMGGGGQDIGLGSSFNDAGGAVAKTSTQNGWNAGTIKVSAQSEVSTKP